MHLHGISFGSQFLGFSLLVLIAIGATARVRRAARAREMEHRERITAMEMGLDPRPSGLSWPMAAVCIAIGLGVPVGVFVVTWLAQLTTEAPDGIWVAPVFVSFPAIATARKLSGRIHQANPRIARSESPTPKGPIGKPAFDPDTYDVVGRRG